MLKILSIASIIGLLIAPFHIVLAQELQSDHFVIRDSNLSVEGGGFSSSTSFNYVSTSGDAISGESESSSFKQKSGLLDFPTGANILSQKNYRWYENGEGGVQPGAPLAVENTTISNQIQGNIMRLRISIGSSGGDIFPSGRQFKLQFAVKPQTLVSCADIPSNEFNSIGALDGSVDWTGYDNVNLQDGSTLSSNLLSASQYTGISKQTYEEENFTAGTPNPIYNNSEAEWEWSLAYRGRNRGKYYCFRMVFADGTLLNSYERYPSASSTTIPPTSEEIEIANTAELVAKKGIGGGGGLNIMSVATQQPIKAGKGQISFTGKSYPESKVVLLKDGQISSETMTNKKGDFEIILVNLDEGAYNFGIYATDYINTNSNTLKKEITLGKDEIIELKELITPPTITINKSMVKKGEDLLVKGQTLSKNKIKITATNKDKITYEIQSDKEGKYIYYLDTSELKIGKYMIVSQSDSTPLSNELTFKVGAKTIFIDPLKYTPGDFNEDGRINLTDFSILAYWYKHEIPTKEMLERLDLFGDGVIDLTDFSILAANWTG